MSKQSPILLMVSFLLLVGLACSMPLATSNPAQPNAIQEPGGQPGAAQSTESPSAALDPTATATPEPTATATPEPPPSHPLGLRQGLAGLNSYRMSQHILFKGPTELDQNDTLTLFEYNKEGDQFHSRTEATTSSADEPEVSSNVTDQFNIAGKTCLISSSSDSSSPDIEVETQPPAQQAMLEGLLNLFDVVLFAEDPVLVGEETVNGIPANHFTFKIMGLSSTTGAEVTQSQGEYWVALEGQYLVKYAAQLETRSAPPGDSSAEVMRLEVEIELKDVDSPITITMPAECQ